MNEFNRNLQRVKYLLVITGNISKNYPTQPPGSFIRLRVMLHFSRFVMKNKIWEIMSLCSFLVTAIFYPNLNSPIHSFVTPVINRLASYNHGSFQLKTIKKKTEMKDRKAQFLSRATIGTTIVTLCLSSSRAFIYDL